ncbi:MAG TPA: DUF3040 domain-containing protein [Streptosporangiaceae bacterium]|nr:DUF3040 domain-containing protein [Streptosporangiaceae bacterium]
MSLSARQQRALGRIEGALRAADPHLASMFAIFARLHADQPIAAEPPAPRRRLRWLPPGGAAYAAVLVPLIFMAFIITAQLGGGARGLSACAPGYPASLVSRPACQLAANTTAVKTASPRPVSGPADPSCLATALAAHPVGWTVSEQAFSPSVSTETTATGPTGACLACLK